MKNSSKLGSPKEETLKIPLSSYFATRKPMISLNLNSREIISQDSFWTICIFYVVGDRVGVRLYRLKISKFQNLETEYRLQQSLISQISMDVNKDCTSQSAVCKRQSPTSQDISDTSSCTCKLNFLHLDSKIFKLIHFSSSRPTFQRSVPYLSG